MLKHGWFTAKTRRKVAFTDPSLPPLYFANVPATGRCWLDTRLLPEDSALYRNIESEYRSLLKHWWSINPNEAARLEKCGVLVECAVSPDDCRFGELGHLVVWVNDTRRYISLPSITSFHEDVSVENARSSFEDWKNQSAA